MELVDRHKNAIQVIDLLLKTQAGKPMKSILIKYRQLCVDTVNTLKPTRENLTIEDIEEVFGTESK